MKTEALYECTGCGHLYHVSNVSCDCMENPLKVFIKKVAVDAAELHALQTELEDMRKMIAVARLK